MKIATFVQHEVKKVDHVFFDSFPVYDMMSGDLNIIPLAGAAATVVTIPAGKWESFVTVSMDGS